MRPDGSGHGASRALGGTLRIVERDLTGSELDRMHSGFAEHGREHENVPGPRTRHGFVLTDAGTLVGSATGLRDDRRCDLSGLWIDEPYRRPGFGAKLPRRWEDRVASEGVRDVCRWTAGFQAPTFYEKQGDTVFAEFQAFQSCCRSPRLAASALDPRLCEQLHAIS